MQRLLIFLLLSCLSSYPIAGYAQKKSLVINSIQLPNHIADNNIQMAVQDEAGLLWFVTTNGANGLYRYDGTELLHFGIGTTPALPSLSITALCADNRGSLWIGFNNGAARLDLKSWTISSLYSHNAASLTPHDKKITTIACLPDGAVYFGTQSGKLFTVQDNTLIQVTDLGAGRKRFTPAEPALPEPFIQNIQEPVPGQLWLATGDGMLVSINKKGNIYDKPMFYKFAASAGIPISNICYDSSGQCLFSVDNVGIFRTDIKQLYREKSVALYSPLSHSIMKLIKPVPLPGSIQENGFFLFFYVPGGQVGIITMGKGLSRQIYTYDFPTNKWLPNSQPYFANYPGESIQSISSRSSDKLAYICSAGGLTAIHSGLLPFDVKLNSNENINSIRAIYANGDSLYIGSYQNYFLRYNKATGEVKRLKTLYVYSILPWGRDTLLLGSEGGGLCWYQPSINKLTFIGIKFDLTKAASVYQSKFITVLCRVNNHLLLEGTTRGINLVDPLNKKLYPVFSNPSAQNMQGAKINAVIPLPFGVHPTKTKYLVGTDAGAFVTNIRNGHTRYLLADNISAEIRQLKVHSLLNLNRQIWIGTSGLGVFAVDSSDKLLPMEWLNPHLNGQIIYSMVKSGTHILIGTNKGLNILDLKDSSIASYDASDGMPSDEFNQAAFFKDQQGVYMGTLNGITLWNEKQASFYKRALPNGIHINKLTVADKNNHIKISYRQAYLPPDSNNIQIPPNTRYFSINFDTPEEQSKDVPYYYRLGPTEKWVNLGARRELTFNNMPPGKYMLQLARYIQGKIIPTAIFQTPMTVLPAYYQTVWFKILVLLIIVSIVILLLRLRQNQQNKERNLRIKIAGDLHDEVGSSLTRIWHQAQNVQPIFSNGTSLENDSEGDMKLQYIAATSQEAISKLSDMVWSINAQYDTLDELVLRIKSYIYQLQDEFDIPVEMSATNDMKGKKVSQIVRQNLFLLFKEGLNNAIKYGDGKLIKITLDFGNKIVMTIENTYFPEKKSHKTTNQGGIGIPNMKRRAEKMNGELKIFQKNNIYILVVTI